MVHDTPSFEPGVLAFWLRVRGPGVTRAGRGLGPTAGRSAPQPGLLGPRLRRAPLWSSALTFRTRVVRHLGNVGQSHGPSSLRPYGLCVPRACENRMTSPRPLRHASCPAGVESTQRLLIPAVGSSRPCSPLSPWGPARRGASACAPVSCGVRPPHPQFLFGSRKYKFFF